LRGLGDRKGDRFALPLPLMLSDGRGGIEFTFEAQDGRTLMTVIQTGFPTTELRDEHARGAPNAFVRLERVIHSSK
jgi:hypothetical protein